MLCMKAPSWRNKVRETVKLPEQGYRQASRVWEQGKKARPKATLDQMGSKQPSTIEDLEHERVRKLIKLKIVWSVCFNIFILSIIFFQFTSCYSLLIQMLQEFSIQVEINRQISIITLNDCIKDTNMKNIIEFLDELLTFQKLKITGINILTLYAPSLSDIMATHEELQIHIGQMLILYYLIKSFQINDLNDYITLSIVDSSNNVTNRYKQFNNATKSNVSWLWCDCYLFMKHLGIKFCYLQDVEKEMQSLNIIDSYLKESVLITTMQKGTENLYINPIVQLLPIFKLKFKNDFNQIYVDEYDKYANVSKIMSTCEYKESPLFEQTTSVQSDSIIIEKQIINKFYEDYNSNQMYKLNPLLIPIHYLTLHSSKLHEQIKYCVTILMQQCHLFKVFHSVLNYIYHQKIDDIIENSFGLMHDGSQTGKSTLQLAIFYAFLFHPNLTKTPIILNNSGGSRTQPLYYQNNLQIQKQIGSLNTNFKLQIEQTQDINVDSFINLVVANLNDFKAYPDNIVNLAQEIQNVLQTMQLIQIIARAKILENDKILLKYSNNNINRILTEPYFDIIIKHENNFQNN
ncbi:Hypothetical_protein [Hexamita inflata]|uniref:Hypothetical_protein n=1 Tax=Hexamita inflata TaxID=28002 RepID=A0AA86NX71_9EUKA|nr:Hypothetical protein HINF_LOCUS15535 [Hexamita inflata]